MFKWKEFEFATVIGQKKNNISGRRECHAEFQSEYG